MSSLDNEDLKGGSTDEQDHTPPRHEYMLAHIVLPQLCRENPYLLFNVLISSEKDNFLAHTWNYVRTMCDPGGEPSFSIEDVRFVPTRIGDFPAFVALFPQPKAMTDVLMAVAVLMVPLGSEEPSIIEHPECRYFTLELTLMDHDKPSPTIATMLCEWDKEGSHLNYGPGPDELSPQRFLDAVQKILSPESQA